MTLVMGARFGLHCSLAHSLKDRRQVIRSLTERLRQTFPVAVGQVDDTEHWQSFELGVAAIVGGVADAETLLERMTRFIEDARSDVEIQRVEYDVMDLP